MNAKNESPFFFYSRRYQQQSNNIHPSVLWLAYYNIIHVVYVFTHRVSNKKKKKTIRIITAAIVGVPFYYAKKARYGVLFSRAAKKITHNIQKLASS